MEELSKMNGYFFLYKHFNRLPTDCLYIIVDKFPETLRTYKKLLEQLNLPLEILFIADNSVNYPLRERCVDLLISFFGDMNICYTIMVFLFKMPEDL